MVGSMGRFAWVEEAGSYSSSAWLRFRWRIDQHVDVVVRISLNRRLREWTRSFVPSSFDRRSSDRCCAPFERSSSQRNASLGKRQDDEHDGVSAGENILVTREGGYRSAPSS